MRRSITLALAMVVISSAGQGLLTPQKAWAQEYQVCFKLNLTHWNLRNLGDGERNPVNVKVWLRQSDKRALIADALDVRTDDSGVVRVPLPVIPRRDHELWVKVPGYFRQKLGSVADLLEACPETPQLHLGDADEDGIRSIADLVTFVRFKIDPQGNPVLSDVLGGSASLGELVAAVKSYTEEQEDVVVDAPQWTTLRKYDHPPTSYGTHAFWTGETGNPRSQNKVIVWGGRTDKLSPLGSADGGLYDPVTGEWIPMSTVGAPELRSNHAAVWTGEKLIIWSGSTKRRNTGFIYDPAADTWTPMTTINAPEGRRNASTIWTGDKMIVWGGWTLDSRGNPLRFNDGGIYDPAADTWSAISTGGAPSPRDFHTAVWTGDKMIVWGGSKHFAPGVSSVGQELALGDGAVYDPSSDSWTPIPIQDAPHARSEHTAIWDGQQMIIWGGWSHISGSFEGKLYYNDGARYDPVTDTWSALSTLNAPEKRFNHSAVWTGSKMIVFGGRTKRIPPACSSIFGILPGPQALAEGGSYDPTTDQWTTIAVDDEVYPRESHFALWTGSEMIVGGGVNFEHHLDGGDGCASGSQVLNDIALYSASTDSWRIPQDVMPLARSVFDMTFTGDTGDPSTADRLLVWGGNLDTSTLKSGRVFDFQSGSWSAISRVNSPAHRSAHTAIWTGQNMIIWGGGTPAEVAGRGLQGGGIYDIASNSWRSMNTVNVPPPRREHSAIWTGDKMIIWGGRSGGAGGVPLAWHNEPGIYDPVANQWTIGSSAGAPAGRLLQHVYWTGTEMLIWGGRRHNEITYRDGAAYDLAQDTWRSISIDSAPPDTLEAISSTWDGQRMYVWGYDFDQGNKRRYRAWSYDLASDVWTELPSPPFTPKAHSGIYSGLEWNGEKLLVFLQGHDDENGVIASYDPVTRSWQVADAEYPLCKKFKSVQDGKRTIIFGGNCKYESDRGVIYWSE